MSKGTGKQEIFQVVTEGDRTRHCVSIPYWLAPPDYSFSFSVFPSKAFTRSASFWIVRVWSA
jgi:hypothetical protein